uniref:Uncharacterized protein n=1 Tax=Onchocerca volvulus TaxID=6282 RepID=A0A8R1TMM7_ONCVO
MGKKIFLRAIEKELLKKCTDNSTNNKKLITFLRNIYEKEARLHPLSMHSLSLSGNFALPKAIFIPPSQIVTLMAEYDADMTIEELLRRLIKSGNIKEQKRRIRYAENFLLKAAMQRRAMHMTNILFELGKNVVASSLNKIEENTEEVLYNHTSLVSLFVYLKMRGNLIRRLSRWNERSIFWFSFFN